MGRELRRVPRDWKHPKDEHGRFVPLHDQSFNEAVDEYLRAEKEFRTNPPDGSDGCTFTEWHGGYPNDKYHRPDWTDEERTHFQMYENTTEGTPISPVFDTPENCARWCANNGASAFGGDSAPYEWWLKVCEGSAGFGLMVTIGTGETSLA